MLRLLSSFTTAKPASLTSAARSAPLKPIQHSGWKGEEGLLEGKYDIWKLLSEKYASRKKKKGGGG
jgi:hypothetical protein